MPIVHFELQMSDDKQKIEDAGSHIRCTKCSKLLLKKLPSDLFEVKCLRCGKLNVIFEQVTNQVVITDLNGRILYINKAVERQTGYSSKEAIGKKPSDLWGKQMPQDFYKKMWQAIKGDKKTFQTTLVNKKKNGQLYKAKLAISPILDTNGDIIFYIATEILLKKKI